MIDRVEPDVPIVKKVKRKEPENNSQRVGHNGAVEICLDSGFKFCASAGRRFVRLGENVNFAPLKLKP